MDTILRRKWVLHWPNSVRKKKIEQDRCMGEDMLLIDITNIMFRFTILSLQTISYVSVKTGSEGDSNK
jgi:hypothetical protein